MTIERKGLLLILSSPSGAGKTTLARALVNEDPNLTFSISVTTRPQRPQEIDGVHYHFVDTATFDQMTQEGAFIETATVFGNKYGTPKGPLEKTLQQGLDMVFDIDWMGARNITQAARSDVVSVFILPPSMAAQEQRLRTRSQDSEEIIQRRLAEASQEISHWHAYDYVIINNEIQKSTETLKAILTSERLRTTRQTGLKAFVSKMTE